MSEIELKPRPFCDDVSGGKTMDKKRGVSVEQAEKIRLVRCGNRGTRLRVLRVSRGMSQEELAAASGVSFSSIRKYDRQKCGADVARLDTLCDICAALGCKIGDIIDDEKLAKRYERVK